MSCGVAHFNYKKVRVRYLVWFILYVRQGFLQSCLCVGVGYGGKKSLQGELKAFFRFSPGNDLLSHILD